MTMLCKLTRWLISREVDRGIKTPRLALRHAERCGACRTYARFAASLPSRFAGERPAFLASVPDFPLNETRWAEDRGVREKRGILPRRLVLHPFPAAAAAVLVVAGALVLFQVVLREPGPSAQDEAAALAALKTVTAAPDEFRVAVAEVESSLTRERQLLEKSVVSAVEYLQARLNIRIVKKETPKSL
jgi:D-serine deaminase-like pyridoxal phosphate-dependent protein